MRRHDDENLAAVADALHQVVHPGQSRLKVYKVYGVVDTVSVQQRQQIFKDKFFVLTAVGDEHVLFSISYCK